MLYLVDLGIAWTDHKTSDIQHLFEIRDFISRVESQKQLNTSWIHGMLLGYGKPCGEGVTLR